jgi:hypothetical protein
MAKAVIIQWGLEESMGIRVLGQLSIAKGIVHSSNEHQRTRHGIKGCVVGKVGKQNMCIFFVGTITSPLEAPCTLT